MAKFVIKNPVLTVNGVDLSNHCSQATIETKFDDVDVSAFGDTYHEHIQGLGEATITLTFWQDFAAGSVDATLWPLSQSGTPFEVDLQPFSGAVSSTNPKYSMTGILLGYNPIDGKVGEASSTQVSIPNAAQSGLTRATS